MAYSPICIYAIVEAVSLRFEWDEAKNVSNQRKHRIGFQMAARVFDDPDYFTEQDREVEGEERWQTIGRIGDLVVVMVAHTVVDAEDDLVVRIISARRATLQERRRYEANTD